MPFPIKFGEEIVNQKEAIWNRKPKDVTEEEYKEFYKQFFGEWTDPLFWIHLNVDYPHRVKGILYFPQVKNEFDVNKGQVKLFCNNVFVADNLKDLIPEFLLLLKGGIDIPDIPLNVSRSFLQNDQMVQKISKYIVKKVADHFKKTFEKERDKYEKYWDDISNFIKYGLLTNENFYDSLKDQIIFETLKGDHVTVEDYLNRYRSEDKPHKIYYTNSKDTQVTYQKLLQDQGIEVIVADSVIDAHLFQHIEMKNNEIRFVRVDSELNDNLVSGDDTEVADENDQTLSDKIKEVFLKALNPTIEASYGKDAFAELIKKYPEATDTLTKYSRTLEEQTLIRPFDIPLKARKEMGKAAFGELFEHIYTDTKVEVKNLKSEDIPAMVMFEEFIRRFQEMNAMMKQEGSDMLRMHTLAVNKNNPTVQKIVKFYEEGKYEESSLLVNFVHELALLEQKRFSGSELQGFVNKANEILKLL
jgi:molecular chaperone HtpG